jgi:hypothetical protein
MLNLCFQKSGSPTLRLTKGKLENVDEFLVGVLNQVFEGNTRALESAAFMQPIFVKSQPYLYFVLHQSFKLVVKSFVDGIGHCVCVWRSCSSTSQPHRTDSAR